MGVFSDQEETAIGWMSVADLFMVGLMMFLLFAANYLQRSERVTAEFAQFQQETEDGRREVQALRDLKEASELALQVHDSQVVEIRDLRRQLADEIVEARTLLAQTEKLRLRLIEIESENTEFSSVIQRRDLQIQQQSQQLQEQMQQLLAQSAELESQRKSLLDADAQIASIRLELVQSQAALNTLLRLAGINSLAESERVKAVEMLAKHVQDLKVYLGNADRPSGTGTGRDGASDDLPHMLQDLLEILRAKDTEVEDIVSRERGLRQELLGFRARDGRFGRVVFVVDRSGSMKRSSNSTQKTRWDYVQGVIENWLLLLPFEEVQLILFNNRVDVYPQEGKFVELNGISGGRRQSIQPLLNVLEETEPDNGTNTLAALQKAYMAGSVDAIFLFTDGQPMLEAENENNSEDFRRLQNQVLDLISYQNERGNAVPINVIALGDYFNDRLSGPDQRHLAFGVFLTTIAQRTGGTFLGR